MLGEAKILNFYLHRLSLCAAGSLEISALTRFGMKALASNFLKQADKHSCLEHLRNEV